MDGGNVSLAFGKDVIREKAEEFRRSGGKTYRRA